VKLLDLFLVGGNTLQPRHRHQHGEQQAHLGMFRQGGLQHQRGVVRVNPRCQPIHHHLHGVLADDCRGFILGCQHMQICHQEKARVVLLQCCPGVESPHQVTNMARPGGSVTGENSCIWVHVRLLSANQRVQNTKTGRSSLRGRTPGSVVPPPLGLQIKNPPVMTRGGKASLTHSGTAGTPRYPLPW